MKSEAALSSTALTAENPNKKSAMGRLRRNLSPRKADKRCASLIVESEDLTQLQRVFDFLDKDGDGKISPAELQSSVRTVGGDELSTEEAEAAVRSSDADGDGLLGFEEFRGLMEGCASEEEKKSELREAFGMYEMEGLGCITPVSLKRMLSRMGESSSTNDCKAMIRAFDLNGDGVLSFDEFAIMMR